ncbi:hypothetical protein C1Y63_06475 [Corynebacterium sp. 13CS0277]|uniref:hypothetical protein n=1 Tax=Corynebacterium sp. 13CS0277 TaxID=2071994 RepID=UPI000D0366A7|nr:hypothetical protein [Corynebacterium sp. 13CS0277]PRQ11349.1 hypothetical protein C1Y63_06475 [Corynebacterium sp. 13CS0277]
MATNGIVPVKISLPQGDVYTLWAPLFREHGSEWQALLGYGDDVYGFATPGALLAFLDSGAPHDLTDHPKWGAFAADSSPLRVVPAAREQFDMVELPAWLAERPSHSNVTSVARAFRFARSLGDVAQELPVQSFFSSHSLLANVDRGSDHYAGEGGSSEWSGVGRIVLGGWRAVVESMDAAIVLQDVDADAEKAATEAIAAAQAAAEQRAKQEEEDAKKTLQAADPYDLSVWGQAGIDPVKIVIDGRTLYTLRTYLNDQPVFLGSYGQITSFNNRKAFVRWLVEHKDHNMANLSTWPEIMDAANGGTLEITVHPDNTYVFTGLAEAINSGPAKVDKEQLLQAYSVLADAADWAKDDSVSSILVANPSIQEFIAYVGGAPSGYVPSAPYTSEVEGWKDLENTLIARFTKF